MASIFKYGELSYLNIDQTESTTVTVPEDDLQIKDNKPTNWLNYILGGLLAIISGLYIVEKTNKKKAGIIANLQPQDATTQIVQLQNTNQSLMAQLQTLSQQLQTDKDKDAAYFTNALSNLVNPIKTALTKQHKQEVLHLAMQIVVQYIAYTHYKTDRLQGSDDYNLQTLSNTDLFGNAQQQQAITTNTATDTIPNELKTMMNILKENQVEMPKGLAYMGCYWQ